jgi:hypothetical protein
MRSVGVERVVQPERLEDHRRQRLLVVHPGRRLDDQAGKNVIGVGIEPSGGRWKIVAVSGIDKADQILAAELMVEVGDLGLADGDRLRVVRDRARHLKQRADGDILPCRILRQPAPDRVVDLQFASGFELEDQRGGEFLRVAADVEQSVRADRLFAAEPVVAGIDRKDRFARAAIHLQRGAGKAFDRRAILDVSIEDLLQLPGERCIIGARRCWREGGGAKKRRSDEQPNPHCLCPARIG